MDQEYHVIQEMLEKAGEAECEETQYPTRTYEMGVAAALAWVINEGGCVEEPL